MALSRQVNETGRIIFLVTSITVIINELKNAKKEGEKDKNDKLDGVVNEHNHKEIHFKLLDKKAEIKNRDTKKVKFKKDVVLFNLKKNSRLKEATDRRKVKKQKIAPNLTS